MQIQSCCSDEKGLENRWWSEPERRPDWLDCSLRAKVRSEDRVRGNKGAPRLQVVEGTE